jgi:outer membrane lipoprotein-sorting protein
MNRSLAVVICFILINCWSNLFAQEAIDPLKDVDSFKTNLTKMAESTSTISCDFVQEKYLVVLSQKIVSKGQFYFKKDNNIRWEYTSPYKYLIIISNNQLYTADEKSQNHYDLKSNKMLQEMNGFISGCVQGDILKNDKDYNITYFENSKLYYVKLVPKSEKMREMLNEVQIWFDKNDLTVSGLKMVESGEDYTKISFIDKKLNIDIPLEKFSFK